MIQNDVLMTIPNATGCYLYYNKDNQIIYVGKAKNIFKRVSSYFKGVHNYKTTKLVREIEKIDYIVVANENEALLLEENLIKKYKPRYNILLADDKKYPYVVIEKKDGDFYYRYIRNYNKLYYRSYGPFPDGSKAREIFYLLERVYPLKRCKLKNQKNPCTYYQLGLCSGACFKEVDEGFYTYNINKADNFFKGNNDDFKIQLTKKMQIAANNLNFEEANYYKSIINSLPGITTKQSVQILDIEKNYDFVTCYSDDKYISIIVLFYQFGVLIYKESFVTELNLESNKDVIFNYLGQLYKRNKKPDLLFVDNDLNISDNKIAGIEVGHTDTKELQQIMNLGRENAIEGINHRYQQEMYTSGKDVLEELKSIAQLKKIPYHIEVFDIANIGDNFVTGGIVVFKNGQPSFSDFRRYNIDIPERDDISRMVYIVKRRYQDLRFIKNAIPDLIIVDGGVGQVNGALKVLKELNLEIDVIGLVKDDKHKTDHIYHPVLKNITLKKDSQLYKKLAMFQDKVHNFSISHYRKRQINSIKSDPLENIKGIGKKTIQKLRESYPNNDSLKNVNIDKLNEIVKNQKLSEKIIKYINK
ncbi:excinuclease ABC subunit UvrC [Spiroplasma endosymbiont of Aspidapion aeneum]|uniref:excinuclease ABC subunit UvrC n=1 Tax=Spiroplasma endosymbiont of Aspidapion aeneum TaxID=3066276 RepID=UPI00313C141B